MKLWKLWGRQTLLLRSSFIFMTCRLYLCNGWDAPTKMTLISPWGLGMFDLEVFQCRIVWKEFTSLKYYMSTILRQAHASFVDSLFSPVSWYPNRGGFSECR
jgi:hypothetical protein